MQSVENKRGSGPSGFGSLHIVLQDIFSFCAFFRYLLSSKLLVTFPGLWDDIALKVKSEFSHRPTSVHNP